MSYSMTYSLTDKEARRGMALIWRPMFAGPWRVLLLANTCIRSMGYMVTGFLVAILALRWFGIPVEDAGHVYYLLALGIAISFLLLLRVQSARIRRCYLCSRSMSGQTLFLDQAGITLSNGRSRNFTAWHDIDALSTGKAIMVAVSGVYGIILPDRLLAKAGEVPVVRRQVETWHAAGHA
ncbi:YcxB family protein [Primorskyibacter sp. 2E107]|uniref:YcxB family protein n=1 Tax=Primorskyibacter sp. 2E107 TaxID=3403458 RepID=UPI003AF7F19A